MNTLKKLQELGLRRPALYALCPLIQKASRKKVDFVEFLHPLKGHLDDHFSLQIGEVENYPPIAAAQKLSSLYAEMNSCRARTSIGMYVEPIERKRGVRTPDFLV